MNVIGIQMTEAARAVKWNDLLEARKTMRSYSRFAKDEQERITANSDADFYARTLTKYASQ
jgi:hypothetical protein